MSKQRKIEHRYYSVLLSLKIYAHTKGSFFYNRLLKREKSLKKIVEINHARTIKPL
jgi:hypothetical protein